MVSREQDLARQFANANEELIALLDHASPAQWRSRTLDEGELRPIGIIAHHVAWGHTHIARRVEAFARGLPVPARRPDLFDERNAQHARESCQVALRDWDIQVSAIMFEVGFNAASVSKSGARCALARARLGELGLTVRVQRVIERPSEYEFFVIIGHRQLKPADERVQTT